MLIPYTKEDLSLLKNIIDSKKFGSMCAREANLLNVLKWSLFSVDDLSYTPDRFFEDLAGSGESEWLNGKYTLVAQVLNYPLEIMPLLINHVKAPISMIAQWRLQIAK